MELASLISKIRDAGVVGAGGAGFPTHQKLNNSCETVIVNGAECEPLLQVDQQLMEMEAEVLVCTLEEVLNSIGANKGIIALKAKYEKAVRILGQVIKRQGKGKKIELFLLGDFYPAGDEQVLVFEVLGRVVPPGGIPLQVGVVVINVETLVNVARACNGNPVVNKFVTITGAVKNPITLSVPMGMPINNVIRLAGGPSVEKYQVLEGGPMMGKLITDMEQGVTKTTKGLILLPEDHRLWRSKQFNMRIVLKRAMAACCHCTACTDLCPRYLLGHKLEPHRLLRILSHNLTNDLTGVTSAQLCCECGACDLYACPMELSPRLLNAAVKAELVKHKFKLPPAEKVAIHWQRDLRKIPAQRLIARLGLSNYYRPAPLLAAEVETDLVKLQLKQHVGVPCYPVVNLGEKVEKGQIVAAVPEGQLGSPIHASISGTIVQVAPQIVIAR
jgi:Na+-translocating ferredoxin:NAD+ oxidoreductase RnfC subunit